MTWQGNTLHGISWKGMVWKDKTLEVNAKHDIASLGM
jgi:hypothetical protein